LLWSASVPELAEAKATSVLPPGADVLERLLSATRGRSEIGRLGEIKGQDDFEVMVFGSL
jgi:hypothetical protein